MIGRALGENSATSTSATVDHAKPVQAAQSAPTAGCRVPEQTRAWLRAPLVVCGTAMGKQRPQRPWEPVPISHWTQRLSLLVATMESPGEATTRALARTRHVEIMARSSCANSAIVKFTSSPAGSRATTAAARCKTLRLVATGGMQVGDRQVIRSTPMEG